MKKSRKTYIILTLLAISSLCIGVGTACSDKEKEGAIGEPYEWVFDKPFAGEIDDYMKIDGKLDEDVWQGKNVLSHATKGVSWSSTTHFSDKGMYLGVSATDTSMIYNTRYTSRSAMAVYICKTGTQTYDVNDVTYHRGRTFVFELDPYYCRSRSRVPYYYKASIDGELNGEEACTMTSELFLSWEDLYYTQEELGENGYPEDIQIYVNYEGESSEVIGTCSWREETYLLYDENGYTGNIAHTDFGSIENSLASTDRWEINEAGNPQTTAGRTQILWLKDAYAKDFIFDAELKPLNKDKNGNDIALRGRSVSGRIGLVNATENAARNSSFTIYSAAARDLIAKDKNGVQSGAVSLNTCREIDSFHWQNLIGLNETTMSSGYSASAIVLRVVKQGDMFYYFYGDSAENLIYWGSERVESLQDKAYCGVYTSQGVEILNHSFTDFTGKDAELREKLSQYMYFVDVPGTMSTGTVKANRYTVPKGESVEIAFLPASRSVLTQVSIDGVDKYEEVVAAMDENCVYTYTPTKDVSFDAKFTAFEASDLVRSVVVLKDKNGAQIKQGEYQIRGSDKLLFYSGEPNATGYVIVQIPKKGTYTVDGRIFNVDGKYKLYANCVGYHAFEDNFELTDSTTSVGIKGEHESVSATKTYTKYCTLASNDYGSVSVNEVTVGSATSPLKYNADTDNYYISSGNNFSSYLKEYVGETYWVKTEILLNGLNGADPDKDPISGIILHNGMTFLELKVKSETEDDTRLIITTVAGDIKTEFAVAGFDAVAYGSTSRTIKINVAKYQDKLYLMNSAGDVKVVLSKDGYKLFNGATVSWTGDTTAIDANLKEFFSIIYPENAVGMLNFQGTENCTIEWNFLAWSQDVNEVKTSIGMGELVFEANTDDYTATDIAGSYVVGEEITVVIEAKGAMRKIDSLTLTFADTTTATIHGSYDSETGKTTFTFGYSKPCTVRVNMVSAQAVQVSGTVVANNGVDLTQIKVIVDGQTYEGKVSAEGNFSFDANLYQGEATAKFVVDGYVQYKTFTVIEGMQSYDFETITMVADTYDIGAYGCYSGETSVIMSSDVANGTYTVSGMAYTLLMPNTATKDYYTYEVQMSNPIFTTGDKYEETYLGDMENFGIAIASKDSNGKTSLLEITFRRWGMVCVTLSEDGVLVASGIYSGGGDLYNDTITVKRMPNILTITCDTITFSLTADGMQTTMTTPDWGGVLPTSANEILSNFFGENVEHVLGFSGVGSQGNGTVTYIVAKYESTPIYTMTGAVLFNDTPAANINVYLDGEVIATTNAQGEYTVYLEAGTYRLTFKGENVMGSLRLTVAASGTMQSVVLQDTVGELKWLWGNESFTENRDTTLVAF